MDIVVFLFPSR